MSDRVKLILFIILFIGLLLGIVATGHAQDSVALEEVHPHPNANFGVVHTTLYDDAGHPSKWILPVPHPVVDRSFLAFEAMDLTLTVVDIENTHYVLQHGGRELNPLYGPHPSRDRQYLVAGSIFAFTSYMAYRYKRIQDAQRAFGVRPGRPAWYWFNILDGGAHAFGTIFTVVGTGR